MIDSRHIYFYWGGPLLFGPPQCIFLGGPDPPDPPGNRRACLPCNTLIILYYSLIHTHLHYALPLCGATYKSYLIKLKRLQNKALRIISKTKIRGRITP